jgi:hypothetical protein
VGNLGRDTFRGPGFIQTDASLSKKFAITERVSLSVRLDGYNVPNRTNRLLRRGLSAFPRLGHPILARRGLA